MLIQLKNYKDMIVLAISIHLMLMLIEFASCSATDKEYFNTSHVNVNLTLNSLKDIVYCISIHLMLMLIVLEDVENPLKTLFQYISC